MVNCPHCHTPLPAAGASCPACTAPLKTAPPPESAGVHPVRPSRHDTHQPQAARPYKTLRLEPPDGQDLARYVEDRAQLLGVPAKVVLQHLLRRARHCEQHHHDDVAPRLDRRTPLPTGPEEMA